MPRDAAVLITDFDGTMTQRDYYLLVEEQLLTATEVNVHWARYEAGEITHFEALRDIFGAVPAGEAKLLQLTSGTEIEPEVAGEIDALRQAGWEVTVVSAGCGWYIQRILEQQGVEVPIHASPGRVIQGRLVMELPTASPFFSQEYGIDKAAVVREALQRGGRVAYAGDGIVDLEAALLVPAQFRFARRALAAALRKRGEAFHPFERWSQVARTLRGATPT